MPVAALSRSPLRQHLHAAERGYSARAQHHDLRFFVRNRVGALSQLDTPEEVGLVNFDGDEFDDGVWYSSHLLTELKAHSASSLEDKRIFATNKYTMEVVVAKNNHLFTRAAISYSRVRLFFRNAQQASRKHTSA